jgi:hypothetical protein
VKAGHWGDGRPEDAGDGAGGEVAEGLDRWRACRTRSRAGLRALAVTGACLDGQFLWTYVRALKGALTASPRRRRRARAGRSHRSGPSPPARTLLAYTDLIGRLLATVSGRRRAA